MTNMTQTYHALKKRNLKFCLLSTAVFTGYMNTSFAMEKETSDSTLDLSDRFLKELTYKQQDYLALVPLIKNSQAQVLHFNKNLNIEAPQLIFEGDPIPENLKTSEKVIDGFKFTCGQDPFEELIKAFVGNQHFRQASFRETLNDSKIRILFDMWLTVPLSNLRQLTVLDLSHNKLDFGFVGNLAKVLEGAVHLKTLNLSHIPFGRQGSVFGKDLQNGLAAAKSLEHVNFANTQLSRDLLRFIYKGISKNQNLKYLDISDNPNLKESNSLGSFESFEKLNDFLYILFKNNSVSDYGLQTLASLLIPKVEDKNDWLITLIPETMDPDDIRNSIYIDLSRDSIPLDSIEKLKSKISQWYNIESNDQGKLIIRGKSLPETYVPEDPFASASLLTEEQSDLKKHQVLMDALNQPRSAKDYETLALTAHEKGWDDMKVKAIKRGVALASTLSDMASIAKAARATNLFSIVEDHIRNMVTTVMLTTVEELDEGIKIALMYHAADLTNHGGKLLDVLTDKEWNDPQSNPEKTRMNLIKIAQAYCQIGLPDNAETVLGFALHISPVAAELSPVIHTYHQLGFESKALEILDNLIAKSRTSIEFWNVAYIAHDIGCNDKATHLLLQAHALCQYGADYAPIGKLYNTLGMRTKALEILKEGVEKSTTGSDLGIIAGIYMEIGVYDFIEHILDLGVKKSTKGMEFGLFARLYHGIGMTDKARDVLKLGIEKSTRAIDYSQIAEVAIDLGMPELAQQALQTGIQDLSVKDSVDIAKVSYAKNLKKSAHLWLDLGLQKSHTLEDFQSLKLAADQMDHKDLSQKTGIQINLLNNPYGAFI